MKVDDYQKGYIIGILIGVFSGFTLARNLQRDKKLNEKDYTVPDIRTYYKEGDERPYKLMLEYTNPNTGDILHKGGMSFKYKEDLIRYMYTISFNAIDLCKGCE